MIHPFGIGDALFMTPLIRTLKENGVRKIDLLLGSRTREVFAHNPHIRCIYEWDKSKLNGPAQKIEGFVFLLKLFFMLMRNRYQVVFDFSLSREYAFLAWFVFWIPARIGFDFKGRGTFLTHKINLTDGFSGKSVVEFYSELGNFLGLQVKESQSELFLSQEDHDEAESILKGAGVQSGASILALAPGGGESWGKDARLKRWPVEYFAGLIRRIREEGTHVFDSVLIVGSQSDMALGDQLTRELNGFPTHNLCGRTSVRTAAALLKRCSLFIANDGGLVHMAHAVGTPVAAIYGPVDPQVYGPYPKRPTALVITNDGPECRPCYRKMRYQADCSHVNCLNALMPEQVWERIREERFLERFVPC